MKGGAFSVSEVLKPVGQWIAQNVPLTILFVLFLLSIFFKIPKKEINILSWLGNKISDIIFGGIKKDIADLKKDNAEKFKELKTDTDTRIKKLEDSTKASLDEIILANNHNCVTMQLRLNDIEKKQDMQTISRVKVHILNFAEDIRKHGMRTKEDFDGILDEDKEYCELVEKYHLENNKYTHAIKYINDKYDEGLRENSFATY